MNAERPLDARELALLRTEMRLACDMSLSVQRLRGLGYSDRAIVAAFEAVRPRGDGIAGGIHHPPLLRNPPAKLRKVDTDRLDLYALDDFLSRGECERIVSLVAHHLHPSALSYVPDDKAFRTSQTAELCHLKSPAALQLDAKICRTLGVRAEYSEGIQAQRYDVGQQFKPHWDYFPVGSELYKRFAGVRGNRTWTFMVYLNDGMTGGATRFTEIDLEVQPKRGMALLWNNLRPDGTPNPATMHCGEPVIAGHKIIITKWFRAMGDGPVFYD
jgi:prolyl 4-hydroxylase